MSTELIILIVSGIFNIFAGINIWRGRELKKEEKETDSNISVNLNASNREDFNAVLNAIRTDGDILRKDNQLLRTEINEIKKAEELCSEKNSILEKRFNKLAADFKLLQFASPTLPTPAWMKDEAGIMISLNDEYEELYLKKIGKTREDYLGKTDIEFWGKEIGEIYHRNDLLIMKSKKPKAYIEPLKTEDGIKSVYVIKYPLIVGEEYVVGIGGHTIAEEFVHMFNDAMHTFNDAQDKTESDKKL